MFDETEERPESLRSKKLKELLEELMTIIEAEEPQAEEPAPEMPVEGEEMPAIEEKPSF